MYSYDSHTPSTQCSQPFQTSYNECPANTDSRPAPQRPQHFQAYNATPYNPLKTFIPPAKPVAADQRPPPFSELATRLPVSPVLNAVNAPTAPASVHSENPATGQIIRHDLPLGLTSTETTDLKPEFTALVRNSVEQHFQLLDTRITDYINKRLPSLLEEAINQAIKNPASCIADRAAGAMKAEMTGLIAKKATESLSKSMPAIKKKAAAAIDPALQTLQTALIKTMKEQQRSITTSLADGLSDNSNHLVKKTEEIVQQLSLAYKQLSEVIVNDCTQQLCHQKSAAIAAINATLGTIRDMLIEKNTKTLLSEQMLREKTTASINKLDTKIEKLVNTIQEYVAQLVTTSKETLETLSNAFLVTANTASPPMPKQKKTRIEEMQSTIAEMKKMLEDTHEAIVSINKDIMQRQNTTMSIPGAEHLSPQPASQHALTNSMCLHLPAKRSFPYSDIAPQAPNALYPMRESTTTMLARQLTTLKADSPDMDRLETTLFNWLKIRHSSKTRNLSPAETLTLTAHILTGKLVRGSGWPDSNIFNTQTDNSPKQPKKRKYAENETVLGLLIKENHEAVYRLNNALNERLEKRNKSYSVSPENIEALLRITAESIEQLE